MPCSAICHIKTFNQCLGEFYGQAIKGLSQQRITLNLLEFLNYQEMMDNRKMNNLEIETVIMGNL